MTNLLDNLLETEFDDTFQPLDDKGYEDRISKMSDEQLQYLAEDSVRGLSVKNMITVLDYLTHNTFVILEGAMLDSISWWGENEDQEEARKKFLGTIKLTKMMKKI